MPPIYSLLWIGSAEGLGAGGATRAPSLDITWVRDADEALALPPHSVTDFDAALLDGEASALLPAVRRLRRHRRFPPLVVRLREPAGGQTADLLAAGAADVLIVKRSSEGAQPGTAGAELVQQIQRIQRLAAKSPRQPALDFDAHDTSLGGIITNSPAMRPTLALVERARHSLATVLLTGETGTGKEVVARAIHSGGPRKDKPFVAVNCAAFPETLLESELFGHKKGAFTGAHRDKPGLFEAADGGTLLLDEIAETPAPLQAKLLRALQEREVRPVGSSRSRAINVRVIAATNQSLSHGPGSEGFRRDLYYRLAVFPIAIPPLRKRGEDILPLAQHFLALHGSREGKAGCRLSPDATRLLLAHTWPGNVRELENEMQRALALAEAGEPITAKHLSPGLSGELATVQAHVVRDDSLKDNMHRVEAWMIRQSLEEHGGRRAATARKLGITREGLYKKMKRLNID